MKVVWISLFGLLGILARYGVGLTFERYLPDVFPLGTFLINVIGSFFIGAVFVLGAERFMFSEEIRFGLMVGFLGGFTTFSAYCLETWKMIENTQYLLAGFYFGLSPILGLAATYAGIFVARTLVRNS